MSIYYLSLQPHILCGDVKVFFILKPNLSLNLDSLFILRFSISLPVLGY